MWPPPPTSTFWLNYIPASTQQFTDRVCLVGVMASKKDPMENEWINLRFHPRFSIRFSEWFIPRIKIHSLQSRYDFRSRWTFQPRFPNQFVALSCLPPLFPRSRLQFSRIRPISRLTGWPALSSRPQISSTLASPPVSRLHQPHYFPGAVDIFNDTTIVYPTISQV